MTGLHEINLRPRKKNISNFGRLVFSDLLFHFTSLEVQEEGCSMIDVFSVTLHVRRPVSWWPRGSICKAKQMQQEQIFSESAPVTASPKMNFEEETGINECVIWIPTCSNNMAKRLCKFYCIKKKSIDSVWVTAPRQNITKTVKRWCISRTRKTVIYPNNSS